MSSLSHTSPWEPQAHLFPQSKHFMWQETSPGLFALENTVKAALKKKKKKGGGNKVYSVPCLVRNHNLTRTVNVWRCQNVLVPIFSGIVPASEQQWGKCEWSQRCFTGLHRLFCSALPKSPFPGSWCVCIKTSGTTFSLFCSHFLTAATLSDGRGLACCSREENIIYKDHCQASKDSCFSFSRRISP